MEQDSIYRIAGLIFRKFLEELTEAECAELEEWAEQAPRNRMILNQIGHDCFLTRKQIAEKLYNSVIAYRKFEKRQKKYFLRRRLWTWGGSAAASLAIIWGGAILLQPKSPEIPLVQEIISAGESKAILTLANGEQMHLFGSMADTIVKCGEASVNVNGGNVQYSNANKAIPDSMTFNRLTVPRKGEFMLTLADGTKVWLNSESQLKYPVRFSQHERIVWLEGEAYFEVTQDVEKPFIVHMADVAVKVLGTSFNVRAYQDESNIYTTLVEGKVRLAAGNISMELFPDEQGIINTHTGEIRKETVDTRLYSAWKDGRFIFQEQRLEEIMNTLSRWYDIQVFFSNQAVRDVIFTGNLKKYDDFSKIIGLLEMTGMAHFKVNGNTIYISN